MKRTLTTMALGALIMTTGCGDNLTPPPERDAFQPGDPQPLECLPNLDGQIDASELQAALGVTVNYLVNPVGETRRVDLVGEIDGDGRRVWDFSQEQASDQVAALVAVTLDDQWFAQDFPEGQFVTPLDLGGLVLGVYSEDDEALRLHGVASAQPDPPQGRTLLVYETPIALYRFPLRPGDAWTETAEVRNGQLQGVPYAGRDVYEVKVDGSGEVVLPGLRLTQALRVRTTITIAPAAGVTVRQRQTSFLFECFGEVARATSENDEPDEDFEVAAEVRRLGF